MSQITTVGESGMFSLDSEHEATASGSITVPMPDGKQHRLLFDATNTSAGKVEMQMDGQTDNYRWYEVDGTYVTNKSQFEALAQVRSGDEGAHGVISIGQTAQDIGIEVTPTATSSGLTLAHGRNQTATYPISDVTLKHNLGDPTDWTVQVFTR